MQQASSPLSSSGPSTTGPSTLATANPQNHVGRRILTNTSALAATNLWRILISFVLQLLISRQLGVEGVGYYTIALTYLNVCQVISELGLPAMLTRDLAQFPSQRRSYFFQSLWIQIALGTLAWAALTLLSLLLPMGETTQRILLLVGAALPLYAVTSACQTLFQASERLELIFGVETFINTLILSASLIILWREGTIISLVAVLIATQALSALVSLLLVRFSKLMAEPQEKVPFQFWVLWRRARPFFGLAVADVLLQRLDTLVLSLIGNVTITGIYGTSDNLVRVLLKLVQSLWRALYPTLSRLHLQSQRHYEILCRLSLRYGLIILLPGAALGAVVAGDLLRLVYGEEFVAYTLVLQIAIWTAPAFLLELYAVTLLMVENRPLDSVLITAAHLLVILVLLAVLIGPYGAVGAAIAVTVAGIIGSTVGVWLLRKHGSPLDLSKAGEIVVAAAIAALIAWILPIHFVFKLICASAGYLLLLWVTRALTIHDLHGLSSAIKGKPVQFGGDSKV